MANRRFIDFPIASTSGDSDIILIWQSGVNKQTTKATFLSGLPENLDELNDVAISGLTNGQILRYDSVTGKWENTDQGNLDLNDLNDVSIVSPSNGQVLVYNSSTSKWENSSGGFVPYTGAVTTVNLGAQTIQAGQFVKAGGTAAQFLKADGSIDSTAYGTGSVTSVGLTMPTAFTVGGSPITTAGTLAVTGAGTVAQYVRGDGSLADFPESSGGGSSVSYYLNGSVNQGTIGGVAYKELNKVPILGAGTDFTINANGYIASFLTDAGDPNLLEIPGGNWNFETYFSANNGGGSPTFYVELYKYDGTTFTLLASNSTVPELIAFGTNITAYFTTLAVPTTTLALTDRLAVRYYVTHSGRTITMHTEGPHLCQIITTFTTGLTALNGLTAQVQNFAVGTSGTDFAIASATATHTFNLPTASATNRGALSSADWSTFNAKQNALTLTTTGSSGAATLVGSTLNIPNYSPDLSGYVPTSRTITINGTTQDLSANRTFNVGTVTSVGLSSATSGVTIGSTPVTTSGTITLAIATASGSQNGLLSSTDWTTFNSKQNALTNPVTGTGTTNYLPKFTGSTTIGNSIVSDNGSRILINTGTTNQNTTINATKIAMSRTSDGAEVVYFSKNTDLGTEGTANINGYDGIQFRTQGAESVKATLNSSGNLGLGVTPSAWGSNYRAIQISSFAAITQGGNDTYLGNNWFNDGANKYLQTSGASIYGQSNGSHQWLTAPSGTAGNAITFTQAMTLTNAGYLVLGSTSSVYGQAGRGTFEMNGSADNILAMRIGGGLAGYLYTNSSAMELYSTTILQLSTAGSIRATLTSGGNLLVGTTTDAGQRLQVTGAGGIRINATTGTAAPGAIALSIRDSGNTAFGFDFNLEGVATGDLYLMRTNSGVQSTVLQVARATGAATFSSSVTAGGNVLIPAGSGLAWVGDASRIMTPEDNVSGALIQTPGIIRLNAGGTERMRITSGGNAQYTGDPFIYSNTATGGTSIHAGLRFHSTDKYIRFFTNDLGRVDITSGGNVLIGTTTDVGARLYVDGAFRTAAPSGGSAVNWKLGTARGGTITPNAIVRVEIDGVLVDLDARYV